MKTNRNVLVVGDLHAPFSHRNYLKHCKEVYERYNCNEVVFIGDVVDNHYSSYHETNPDGLGAGEELDAAIKEVQKWYEAFGEATVIIGNHDRIVTRKAFSAQLPNRWVKTYNEVLGTPNWNWKVETVIDGVRYVHGEGGTARKRMQMDGISTVQGHLHTQQYVEYQHGYNNMLFGMQVGSGIDADSYAMAYAKAGKAPALGCGVVLAGRTAIVEPMKR